MKRLKEELSKAILFLETRSNLFRTLLAAIIGAMFMLPTYALGATNYGENFGKYALEQLFWVAVVIIALGLIGCIVRKNVVGIVGCIIIGVVVVGFMSDPSGIKTVGQDLWSTIKG